MSTAPSLPAPPEITPQRLWFYSCVANFIHAQIQELTGWSRTVIRSRLSAYRLGFMSVADLLTDEWIDRTVAEHLGIVLPLFDVSDDRYERRAQLQDEIQRRVRDGRITIQMIDAFPMPPVIAAEIRWSKSHDR